MTSTARPAATPPATPVLGASASKPMPTATLATGVIAAMTGSVTMGRPAWQAVWVSSTFPALRQMRAWLG